MTIEQAGLDDEERSVLNVARCFFCAFSEPNSHAWRHAIAATDGRGATALGPHHLGLVLEMVQAMRSSRHSCFQFNSPFCKCCSKILSEHERQFIGTLTALREGRHSAARTHAMLLCEGNETTGFLDTALQLSKSLSIVAGRHRDLRPLTEVDLGTTPAG